jgi:hypothetical protein
MPNHPAHTMLYRASGVSSSVKFLVASHTNWKDTLRNLDLEPPQRNYVHQRREKPRFLGSGHAIPPLPGLFQPICGGP